MTSDNLARLHTAANALNLPAAERAQLVARAARTPSDVDRGDWGEGPVCWLAEAELARLQARGCWDPDDPLQIKAPLLLEVRDPARHLVLRVVRSRLGPLLVACWWGPRHLQVREAFQQRRQSGPPPLWGAGILADLPLVVPDDPAMHAPLEPTCDNRNGRCGRFELDPAKVRAAILSHPPRPRACLVDQLTARS